MHCPVLDQDLHSEDTEVEDLHLLLYSWFDLGNLKNCQVYLFFFFSFTKVTVEPNPQSGFQAPTGWTLLNPVWNLTCVRCYYHPVLLQSFLFLTWTGPAQRAVAGTSINVWPSEWTTHFIISPRCLPWVTQTVPKTFTSSRHSWLLNRVHQTFGWKLSLTASSWRSPISLHGPSVSHVTHPKPKAHLKADYTAFHSMDGSPKAYTLYIFSFCN